MDWRSILTAAAGKRSRWLVLLLWLVVAGIAGPLGGKLSSVEKNEESAYLPGSAESTKALILQQRFPGGEVTPAIVVYRRAAGLTAADRTRARADRLAIVHMQLKAARTPGPIIPSRDGKALLLSVPIVPGKDVQTLIDDVKAIRQQVGAGGGGLDIKVTGPAGFSADAVGVFTDIDTKLLLATTTLVVVLLLLIYRSPILWIVPLIALGFAEISAQALAYGMARAGLTVSGQTGGLLTVLVFGAGTDYALLLIARYREELRRHEDKHEAMRYALRQAGPAILASGGTVVIALLCLLAAELNSTSGLGPIGAAGILMALISMLTALPALLLVFGRRLFWPAIPRYGHRQATGPGLFGRLTRWIEPRPQFVWIVTALALAVMALGLIKTNTGLNSLNGFRSTPDSILGQRLLAQSFPAGASAATYVFVRPAREAAAARVAAMRTPGVAGVSPVRVGNGVARLDVTLASPPYGTAAFDTISHLRDNLRSAVGSAAPTGGPSAQELDTRLASIHDAKVIVPLVLLTVLIILAVLLRAVVAPLVLVATVILSFAAALGVSVIVFDRLFGFAGIDPSLPLLAFVFLVALGIDYNIFLMARIREESERLGTHRGVLTGLTFTGGVITSAGIVLAGTFSILGILPLVALTEIGFIVAFGVLLDTFVVRSILVPALALTLGARIWWPSALSREIIQPPTAEHVTDVAATVSR
jgi:RND superfamily putative drug exporter